eukprot:Gregarina_sp_Poly_1__4483@NODE_240_length_10883_cov_144_711446_g211_i0_p2_GENE_NODE_240_length_10883_cov_144_711446_g211_i0NODE_240_length_10883_cov_144_711446_g211_i0_p2_ORF_typecomplete_len785_score101_01Glyco_transf_92/PF01697_27/2_9e21Glyco_transf_92/PF01697_27/7e03Glyco_transf_92/PF01697_27/9_5e03Glyco_tranf_2_4/PF13704_6/1e10_NODE_240_length_10883_cov_144_711446_g211_i045646918
MACSELLSEKTMRSAGRNSRVGLRPLVFVVLSTAAILLFLTSKRLIDEVQFLEIPPVPRDSKGTIETIHDDPPLPTDASSQTLGSIGSKRASKHEMHRLIMCAKVGNEIPYLPEWIEFHRIQGFTKFVFYVDDIPVEPVRRINSNQILALRNLYEQLGDFGLVEVYSLTPIFESEMSQLMDPTLYSKETVPLHRLSQQTMLKHCWENYKLHTEWIAHIDVDEFIYAPKHQSISEFMKSMYTGGPEDYPSGSLPLAYQFGNISGAYLWSVNFGLGTDAILTPRVALRSSSIRGESELIFDPSYANRASQERLLPLLEWLQSLEGTVHANVPRSVRAFFEGLLHKDPRAGMQKSLFDEYLNVTLAGPKIENMMDLFNDYFARAAQDFFLVTETQSRRMANVDYGDSFDTVADAMIKIYPHCFDYVNELRKPENVGLQPKIAHREREKKLGPAPFNECIPGEMPLQITNVGKTIFWTGNRYDPPLGWNRTQAYKRSHQPRQKRTPHRPEMDDPELRLNVCQQPWVHHCAHRSWAPVVLADLHNELRLDHHMARSLESRTIADSEWRVSQSKLGKFVDFRHDIDFGVLVFVNALDDFSKVRFIPELKRRIARLAPIPIATETTMKPNRIEYATRWKHASCQLIQLLQRKQSMCPSSHPFVGILGHLVPPPIGFQPYGWCTNQEGSLDLEEARKSFDDEGVQQCLSDWEPSRCAELMRPAHFNYGTEDIVFCSGFPNTNCCDYDDDLNSIVEKVFALFGIQQEIQASAARNLTLESWRRLRLLNMHGQF